uniref:NADH-ubiquinone oxidoreductase chain 1 n=1 Tax=Zele chlorophthalmus TaxID=1080924 RepID=A0A345X0P6_ZELCH|nr:NADH dehydrogenase subunit 1 [Zele chlorophthalmus]AXK15288.1 NADH dehydrogenase subunit 1 [Zele chlorophthalmus]
MTSLILLILVVLLIMITVAFMTLFERKIMGLFHYRKGPNKLGMFGLLQPFSDAMKLFSKEIFFPFKSNLYLYFVSPILMLMLSLMMWMIYPFMNNIMDMNLSTLYFLCIMSMGVYPLMFMGWSSSSVFSMIGAIRSIAQSISYEVTFAITLLSMNNVISSLNLMNFTIYSKYMNLLFLFYPIFLALLINMLAEINRTPFDLSESESELVSGFNVEYGEIKFTMIFLSEYSMLIFMMLLISMIFFNFFFSYMVFLNMMLMIFLITWIRMTFPRIRYDKLMFLCWFYILPFSLLNYMLFLFCLKMPFDMFFFN